MPKYTIEYSEDEADLFRRHLLTDTRNDQLEDVLEQVQRISRSLDKHGGTLEELQKGIEQIRQLTFS